MTSLTDALIEKMARAIASASVLGLDPTPFDELPQKVRNVIMAYARAAQYCLSRTQGAK